MYRISLPLALVLALATTPVSSFAAVTPSLGAASSYAVLGSTFTNTTAGTTINGDIGFTTGPAVTPAGTHMNYGPVVPYAAAGSDQGTALSSLSSQPCTFNFPAGAVNLSTETTHGPVGVYTPGVYCSSGAMNIGGPLMLSGNGTFIFRAAGALTSTVGAIVSLNGASACNVFWTPTQATTLAANTIFTGIVIDDAGITVGANTTWIGMALAFGGTVTTDTVTLSVCTIAQAPSSAQSSLPSSASSFSSLSSSLMVSSVSSSQRSSSMQSSRMSSSMQSSSMSTGSSYSSIGSSAVSSSAQSVMIPPVIASAPPPVPPARPTLPITGADMGAISIGGFGLLMAGLSFLGTYRTKAGS